MQIGRVGSGSSARGITRIECDAAAEAAIAANERMGLRPWVAHARHDCARMLLARGASGDRERTDRLLGQALAGYCELGMTAPAGDPAPQRW
jgi:hypothetical protein